MKTAKILILSLLIGLCAISCGGGGGGDGEGLDFVGSADISLHVRPSGIDIGDTTQVTVDILNAHENGILLKVRYPKKLVYVPDSAILDVDGSEINVSPTNENTQNSQTYLVFFLSRDIFADINEGILSLELRGTSGVKDGEVEVDADVNNPAVDDASEFDPTKPQFEPQDSGGIEVSS